MVGLRSVRRILGDSLRIVEAALSASSSVSVQERLEGRELSPSPSASQALSVTSLETLGTS